jgi:tetratricopeptide (TPR) repeat protein
MQIAVYDGYAPADEWLDLSSAPSPLIASGLLEINEHDAVAIASYARPAVLRRIPANLRPILHAQAAETLERRGEYTAAARQYQQAGQPFKAIALWNEHRAEETERGHAEVALEMLRAIPQESLQNDDERRILFALRAELYRKMGAILEGLDDLSSAPWPPAHPLTPYAETLRGDLHVFSGSIEAAMASYESALRALAGQREAREVDIYNRIGAIRLYRARDLEQASQAALRARFRSESFHGKVLEERGDFAGAYERYQAAAALLDQLENATPARAMNESDLGRIAMALGHYDEAIACIQESIRLYEQVGDQVLQANEHMNLSFTLNAAGQYDEALRAATARLQFVQDRGDTYLVSALACNAAESCAHLDQLDEAEHYIALALRQEEEFHRHYILTVQGIVDGKRGQYAQAEQRFTEAIRTAQESEDPFGEAPAWRWLALIYWQQGKRVEARDALARAAALYQTMGMAHEMANIETMSADWGE